MASSRSLMAVLVLLAATLATVKSSTPAPAPAPDCSSVFLSMADCLSYVQNGSTDAKPDAACCAGLKSVLRVSPLCLCEVLQDSSSLGFVLNTTRAIGLPDACNLKAPPVSSMCPAPSPSGATSPAVPPSATPPSSGGNNTTESPVPSPHQSGANILTISSLSGFLAMGIVLICYH